MAPRARSQFRLSLTCALLLVLVPIARELRAQGRTATIVGTVRDAGGLPLTGVEVAVPANGIRTRTDDRGSFRLAGVPAGSAVVIARRLGFHPHSSTVNVEAGSERILDIRLAARADILEAVEVTAPREVYDARLAGFNARSTQNVGRFVTRDRIDRANSTTLSDLLREIPGVRIGPTRNQGRAIRLRGSTCAPLVFVDGFPASAGEFDVDIIDLKSVEGIEVYAGMASVPPEFMGPRDLDRCGVIAIWSRPARAYARALRRPEAVRDSLAALDLGDVYAGDQVEVPARLDSASEPPLYPDSLFRARIGGRVVVEFVVDTAGLVETGTIEVLSSTAAAFTESVRYMLARARFTPAMAKGRRVRQLLQLPVGFSVSPVSPMF